MPTAVNLWPLIGVAIIIAGFVLRFHPMLVVIGTAIATAVAAGFPLDKILATIGTGFIKTRNLPLIILLPLAVIGLLERHGLRQHAQNWISSIRSARSSCVRSTAKDGMISAPFMWREAMRTSSPNILRRPASVASMRSRSP